MINSSAANEKKPSLGGRDTEKADTGRENRRLSAARALADFVTIRDGRSRSRGVFTSSERTNAQIFSQQRDHLKQ